MVIVPVSGSEQGMEGDAPAMAEPAYVEIAATYARRIRSGQLPPGSQLPSYAEIADQSGVSDIVVRKAIELLQTQGLVRSVRRRGVFVADHPNLVRVSPERQMEDPEATFSYDHQNLKATADAVEEHLTGEALCAYDLLFGAVKERAPAQQIVLVTTVRDIALVRAGEAGA